MKFSSVVTLLFSVVLSFATTKVTASTTVSSHEMHQQATNGIISTVAGIKDEAGSIGDGASATKANLFGPEAIAIDSTGSYYIGDSLNYVVRKVTPSTGFITTIAGTLKSSGFSGDGGQALSAQLSTISGIAVDSKGDLYIADSSNNRIRKVTVSSGVISTIAGTGVAEYAADDVSATTTGISSPSDVAVDSTGNVYIADTGNNRIRKITASTGIITTVAGPGSPVDGKADGILATKAYVLIPSSVALDSKGNIYFTNTGDSIKKITVSTGIITTLAGGTGSDEALSGIAASKAKLSSPMKLAVDKSGNIFFGESARIRQITESTGLISVEAGSGSSEDEYADGGLATKAYLKDPGALAFDETGNLIFCDPDHSTIRKITFSGSGTAPSPSITSSPATTPSTSNPGAPTPSMISTPSSPSTRSPSNAGSGSSSNTGAPTTGGSGSSSTGGPMISGSTAAPSGAGTASGSSPTRSPTPAGSGSSSTGGPMISGSTEAPSGAGTASGSSPTRSPTPAGSGSGSSSTGGPMISGSTVAPSGAGTASSSSRSPSNKGDTTAPTLTGTASSSSRSPSNKGDTTPPSIPGAIDGGAPTVVRGTTGEPTTQGATNAPAATVSTKPTAVGTTGAPTPSSTTKAPSTVSAAPVKTPSSPSSPTSGTAGGSIAPTTTINTNTKSASTHSANTLSAIILVLTTLPMALLW